MTADADKTMMCACVCMCVPLLVPFTTQMDLLPRPCFKVSRGKKQDTAMPGPSAYALAFVIFPVPSRFQHKTLPRPGGQTDLYV